MSCPSLETRLRCIGHAFHLAVMQCPVTFITRVSAASHKPIKGWVSGEQSLAMLDSVGGSAVETTHAFGETPPALLRMGKGWVSGEQSLAMLDSVGGSAVETTNAIGENPPRIAQDG